MQAYEKVVRLEPTHGAALSQLLFLRQRLGDWHDLRALRQQFRDGVAKRLPLLSPFVLLSQPSSRDEQRRCAEAWTARRRAARRRAGRASTLDSGRLRIGYLSADFHTHATAFLAAGLFEQHDRARFEVVGYSTGRDDRSPMRARLARGFDRFVDAAGWPALRLAHGDPQRRDRHPRRPQGTYGRRAAVRAGAASGADPGALPRLSRARSAATSPIT